MAHLAALVPDAAVLNAWSDVDAARAWAAVPPALATAVHAALGDGNLQNLVLLAACAPERVRAALDAARFATTEGGDLREPTTLERTRYALMYMAVRSRLNQTLVDIAAPPAAAPAADAQGHAEAVAASRTQPVGNNVVKIKIATVMDQASDMEVGLLPEDLIREKRKNYRVLMGDAPIEQADITDVQLSAFVYQTATGAPPYCDFGVWGPYGARIERRLRFRAHHLSADGKWATTEVPGADSLDTWLDCWEAFKTAALMAQTAHAATLDLYRTEFKRRCDRYPRAWHICAQADIRCRSEFWVAERRRQEAAHATNPSVSTYDPGMPWDSVIRASAKAADFWDVELKEPALVYMLGSGRDSNVRRALPNSAEEQEAAGGTQKWGGRKPRAGIDKKGGGKGGGGGKRRADGRYLTARNGKEICFTWARNENGCAAAQCPNGRMHICEWCRQPHRSIHCPNRKDGARGVAEAASM